MWMRMEISTTNRWTTHSTTARRNPLTVFQCRLCLKEERNDVAEEVDNTSWTEMELDGSAVLTASFNISHRNTNDSHDPQPITEESFAANPDDTVLEDTLEETFTILEGASQRKKPLLVTSTGYSYGIKVRTAAQDRLTEAGLEIVELVLLQQTSTANIPGKQLLKRVANHNRAKLCPTEPKDLSLEIDQEFLKCKNFVLADLRLENVCHIVFATEMQLDTLRKAKRWFIDETFKIVGQPFQPGQLMSILAFVQERDQSQQFPLAFALMSMHTTADYVAVFNAVRTKLRTVSVEGFVLDFEQVAWNAVREVFRNDVEIRGCVFHWCQAAWRQVQGNGLTATYNAKKNTYNYLRQLMALPFLPSSHIIPTFQELQGRPSAPQVQAFCAYMDHQWISYRAFPVNSWIVFRQPVRINNDVEGWHHRINRKAGGCSMSFYRNVPLLRREADIAGMSIRMGDLSQSRTARTARLDWRLQDLSTKYQDAEISTTTFLKSCSALYSPCV